MSSETKHYKAKVVTPFQLELRATQAEGKIKIGSQMTWKTLTKDISDISGKKNFEQINLTKLGLPTKWQNPNNLMPLFMKLQIPVVIYRIDGYKLFEVKNFDKSESPAIGIYLTNKVHEALWNCNLKESDSNVFLDRIQSIDEAGQSSYKLITNTSMLNLCPADDQSDSDDDSLSRLLSDSSEDTSIRKKGFVKDSVEKFSKLSRKTTQSFKAKKKKQITKDIPLEVESPEQIQSREVGEDDNIELGYIVEENKIPDKVQTLELSSDSFTAESASVHREDESDILNLLNLVEQREEQEILKDANLKPKKTEEPDEDILKLLNFEDVTEHYVEQQAFKPSQEKNFRLTSSDESVDQSGELTKSELHELLSLIN